VRWARELADLVALEVSLTWTRLLWLNVLALSAYPTSYELLDPAARIRSLRRSGVAAVISSQALHVLVAATCSISWARALERGVLGNVLTLPVSRRSAFAAKFLTSVSMPMAALRSQDLRRQLYISRPRAPSLTGAGPAPQGASIDVAARGGAVDVAVFRGSATVAEHWNVTLARVKLDVWLGEAYR